MTNLKSALGGVAVGILCLSASHASAQEAEISFDSPIYSQYNWRGINLVNGAVLQPSVDVAFGGLSFNFWTNFELSEVSAYPSGRFSELDTTISYSGSSAELSWSLGFIHYQFPNVGAAATSEVFGSVSKPIGNFEGSLSINYDIEQVEGSYVKLAFDQDLGTISSYKSSQDVGFAWGTSIAYGDKAHNLGYYGNGEAGLADYSLYGGFYSSISEDTDVYLNVQYSTLLDADMLAGAPNRTNLLIGLGFTTSF